MENIGSKYFLISTYTCKKTKRIGNGFKRKPDTSVNIRTYYDGKNVERSVNRGFIRELTFPQGGNAITRRVTLVLRYRCVPDLERLRVHGD